MIAKVSSGGGGSGGVGPAGPQGIQGEPGPANTIYSGTLTITGSKKEHYQTISNVDALDTSTIKVWLEAGTDLQENQREFLNGVEVFGVPSTGSILFTLTSNESISGPILIKYEVQN